MAFIDFTEPQTSTIEAPRDAAAAFLSAMPMAERLSALEWRVVELARGDGLATLKDERKRGWLARLVFGPQPPSAILSDVRLEALRRLAVRAWHEGYLLPVSAVREAIAAGYSELQVGRVLDAIVGERAALN